MPLLAPPDTILLSSGLIEKTASLWVLKGPETIVPDKGFHRIVLSADPEAMYLPSGEKAMEKTLESCFFGGLKIH